MLVYFDTNIYRHVTEAGAVQEVREVLDRLSWDVIASGDNLLETYAITNELTRFHELRTLTSVANRFEKVPHSYLEAMEVRAAIAVHRPRWIRRVVFDRFSREMREAHLSRWKQAKLGILPHASTYAAYKRDFEAGTAKSLEFQRVLRRKRVNKEETILLKQYGNKVGAVKTDLDHPEAFWRSECWAAYDAALVQRDPAARDLYDWLAPHLKLDLITTEELFLFWLRDVAATQVRSPHGAAR